MDLSLTAIIISIFALVLSIFTFNHFTKAVKKISANPATDFATRPLQLQAYERLVMLTERISLPNLVSRSAQPGITAREMQMILTGSIKQEFEYNASQQIYVSRVAWDAVNNLKEQNLLIINQLGATLPPDAAGSELNKRIVEYSMNQENGSLHTIVLQALNIEAKKIMH
jgi:hypothetical protein